MESLITAAAVALARGDALGALNLVALRGDAPALALRGIAMAQLGDLPRARALLRDVARAFGPREAVSRGRCALAEAEIAFVSRDLGRSMQHLAAARSALEAHGDRANAAHAGTLEARYHLLIGELQKAEAALARVDFTVLPPASRSGYALVEAGIAMRRVQAGLARDALERARHAAAVTGIPALAAEVERAVGLFAAPAARLTMAGETSLVGLDAVETLHASDTLVIDGCRHVVRWGETVIALGGRPVLFALVRALALGWPGDVPREALLKQVFRARAADESHRARLRVEIGRLRKVLEPVSALHASRRGFALSPNAKAVAVLAPPVDGKHGAVLAVLADGEAWSSSALALALGVSPRTVLRALEALAEAGKVAAVGRGRACRWITPTVPGFPTSLLLPALLPGG